MAERGYPSKRERTRAALVRAGMVVLGSRGINAGTVGDIAAEAGVVPGTFYTYFPSRPDLVAAVVDELASSLHLGAERVRAMEGDPAGRVALAALSLVGQAHEDLVFGSAFSRLARRAPELTERLRTMIGDAVADGVALGRFEVPGEADATEALFSVAIGAVLAATERRADPDSGPRVAQLMLTMLGLDRGEAQRVIEVAADAAKSTPGQA
ncbi:MAG: TetR/AcrR family transcriptional regulator [Actinomycetia bacterium]|nr:TetR/AcrR family transcriptional regulator [Actinomycetes bacterium]